MTTTPETRNPNQQPIYLAIEALAHHDSDGFGYTAHAAVACDLVLREGNATDTDLLPVLAEAGYQLGDERLFRASWSQITDPLERWELRARAAEEGHDWLTPAEDRRLWDDTRELSRRENADPLVTSTAHLYNLRTELARPHDDTFAREEIIAKIRDFNRYTTEATTIFTRRRVDDLRYQAGMALVGQGMVREALEMSRDIDAVDVQRNLVEACNARSRSSLLTSGRHGLLKYLGLGRGRHDSEGVIVEIAESATNPFLVEASQEEVPASNTEPEETPETDTESESEIVSDWRAEALSLLGSDRESARQLYFRNIIAQFRTPTLEDVNLTLAFAVRDREESVIGAPRTPEDLLLLPYGARRMEAGLDMALHGPTYYMETMHEELLTSLTLAFRMAQATNRRVHPEAVERFRRAGVTLDEVIQRFVGTYATETAVTEAAEAAETDDPSDSE